MEGTLTVWIAITSLAVAIQAGVMVALFFSVKKTSEKVTQIAEDMQRKIEPVLSRLNYMMDETQPQLKTIVSNAAEITELAKRQTYKFDKVFTEAVDRLREQVVRADQIVTGALEGLEEAGSEFKRTVWQPLQKATAVLRGIQSGLDLLRSVRRPPERERAASEEELFI
jgi:hypothetical protein